MNVLKLYNLERDDNIVMKRFDINDQNILSSYSILEWANKNGFNDYTKIKRTIYKKPFLNIDNEKYILIEDIKGKKIKLKNKDDILLSINLLARFHSAAEGYVMPSGIKTSANWGRCMEKYKTLTCNLEKYGYMLDGKKNKTKFELETFSYIDELYNLSKKSIDFFRSNNYINAIEKSMKKREICVNDFTQNSLLLLGANKKPYLTKLFSLGYSMCEEDIASIIRRHIEETGSIEFLEEIINEYDKTRSINNVSKECIKRLALFPETPIKMISKYMKKGVYKEDMLEKFFYSLKAFKNFNMEV